MYLLLSSCLPFLGVLLCFVQDPVKVCILHLIVMQYKLFLVCLIYVLYLFWAVLGLRCCVRTFSSCVGRGLLSVAVRGLLTAVASLVAEHGLQVPGLQCLWHSGSVVVGPGLSCSAAWGIFRDQDSNPCPLQ